jgi:precorrin-6A/cobalt-precorrin-6A reductase
VIDATHPFAAQISRHAETACGETGTPRLMLVRPPWRPEPGERWTATPSFAHAAAYVAENAGRVFLTIGLGELAVFSGLPRVWFLVRTIEEPATPLPLLHYALITGRPPFALEDERELLTRQRIGLLVTKNAGGPTATKLIAARAEGVPVLMIERPPPPAGALVETVDGALDWLARQL